MTRAYQWYVIGRGLAGWHAQGINVRSSGGTLAGYLTEAVDGCLIYDAEHADEDAFIRHVYRGPMCDPALPPDGWSKFWHEEDQPKGLDTVGVTRYRDLLALVAGVKLGTVQGGVITWEAQPSLPGAEHVRATEAALPQFELPAQSFELTPPKETLHSQGSLLP